MFVILNTKKYLANPEQIQLITKIPTLVTKDPHYMDLAKSHQFQNFHIRTT